ncbi:MAG: hypothetical protein ABJB09_02495 [Verrucomicrobiota bacterium]
MQPAPSPINWFFALAEGCPGFDLYGDMIKVAVYTASRHTSLQPHFLYDGGENQLTHWLRDRGVPIIPCRTFLDREIASLRGGKNEASIHSTARGILLRIELAQLGLRLGLGERVLYTDCDVFFRGEVTPELSAINCTYFAVGPESNRDDYFNMNTGVMWMNLPMLRTVDAAFRDFVRQNIARLPAMAWDQGAYREFFSSGDQTFRWEKLQPELNWKPYWGDSAEARIIHFHGPKPFQQPYIDSHFPELKYLTGGSYNELCQQWQSLLAEVK